MEKRSPSVTVRELEAQVRRILSSVDMLSLNSKMRSTLADLNQTLIDSRIYSTDYELSEAREEQLDNAKLAKHYLGLARKDILNASEHNIFNAVDVAHMTAIIDQLAAELK